MSISDAKVRLRTAMMARRAAIPLADTRSESAKLAMVDWQRLSAMRDSTVSGFLSIGDEIDTAPLLDALHRRGVSLCLPVLQGRDRPLLFRVWAPGDPLATVQWGIREPGPDAAVVDPDVLLVPLLAFDATGNRLGYGGGYYDRTIRALRARKTIVAIGVAYDEQRVDAVPHCDYDQRLDWVLTPSGPQRCHG